MHPVNAEFRRETRVSFHGEVLLYPKEIHGYVVGRLLDISKNGFRVEHNFEAIPPGREIGFKHLYAQGFARVAWTQRVGGYIQCGCEIIHEPTYL